VSSVKYLVVSSTIDYSSDLICYELEKRGHSYLRINRDRFANYKIIYSLEKNKLEISINNQMYEILPENLESVYFRAPVFLRTGKSYALEEQLYRSQWSAFIRNLIVFDKARWLNHPVSTYQAENKLFQLKLAKEHGLEVPTTYTGNAMPQEINIDRSFIVKSLDTALFYENGSEMFTYSNIVNGRELMNSGLQYAPVIIQECLENKTDIRVTVIGNRLFAVNILKNGHQIDGDWRQTSSEELNYMPIDLPCEIEQKILGLMKDLNLAFGGVDLALVDGKYYFIEVNPTGEWGWLVSTTSLPIDKAIVDWLDGGVFDE
jgi:glutathione synthase/RimK-type ligase-like ATP-grasp enzyme